MDERRPTNKAEMMEDIARSWEELNTALDNLTEKQATSIKDAEGWTVKDHIIHMTAWERSVVFLLQGKPRHEGLGVEEALYLGGDDDKINAAIYEQRKDLPLAEAREQFRDTHRQLVALLEPMTEDDLSKTYRQYLPDEEGEGEGPPIYALVYGNTSGHFREHLGWIRELLGRET